MFSSRRLNILGRCQLVLSDSGGRPERTVDLSTTKNLRTRDDIPLLVFLATAEQRSRLACIGVISPDHAALATQVRRVGTTKRLLPTQLAELEHASDELDKATSRLRKALNPEGTKGLPNPIRTRRQRDLQGSLWLHDCIETDVRLVREILEDPDRPARDAVKLVGGHLSGLKSPRLNPIQAEFRESLIDWLSADAQVATRFPTRTERARIADELIERGLSQIFTQRMSGLVIPQRIHGPGDRWKATDAESPSAYADYAPVAIDSGDLTTVARDTFDNFLKSWLGVEDAVYPIGSSTVFAELPSRWSEVPPIAFKTDIVVRDEMPRIETFDHQRYLVVELGRSQVAALREAAHASTSSYIALAVPSSAGLRDDYYVRAPHDRFLWWIIDARQYFASDEAASHPDALLIPLQNKWDLSTCALLWSARWVDNFYRPLKRPEVAAIPALRSQISSVFTLTPDRERLMKEGWDALEVGLPRSREHVLDDAIFAKVSFALGLGTAMQLVCGQLEATAARRGQTQIRTYTPEALFGTVSLWLFSRNYHQFMQLAVRQHLGSSLEVNQRLMPILGDDLRKITRLHRMALWYVIVLYRWCGVDVRLIPEPADRSSADRAWYGKNIGNFRWISLDPKGATWVVDQGDPGVQVDHHEFFLKHESEFFVDQHVSEAGYKQVANLDGEGIAIDLAAPRWLFPPPDEFLEHPALWPTSGSQVSRLRQAKAGMLAVF